MEILEDFFAGLKDGEIEPWLIVTLVLLAVALLAILYFILPEGEFAENGPLLLLAILVGSIIAGKRGGS